MKKNFLNFVKQHKIVSGVIGIIVIILVIALIPESPLDSVETASVEPKVLRQEVRATGKVAALDKVDLAFERSGTVSKINVTEGTQVNVGDTLATLNNGTLYADLRVAEARLAAERARLYETTRGTRAEELSVSETRVKNADIGISDARNSFFIEIREAYSSVYDAVVIVADSVAFRDGVSTNPTLILRARNDEIRKSIEFQRLLVTESFDAWKGSLENVTEETNPQEYSNLIRNNISLVKDLLGRLKTVAQELTMANSALTESEIVDIRNEINTAESQVTTAEQSVVTAEKTLNSAIADAQVLYRELDLDIVGNTEQTIQAQNSKVAEVEAQVTSAQIAVSEGIITSPIKGVVTRVIPKEGESVSANTSAITVMNTDVYKVEVQIPEVDIAKVKQGDRGIVTLDAYGPEVQFNVIVSKIDPAEDIVGGIPTYRTTLIFENKDTRIRSGMTANIILITGERDNVLAIPFQAIKFDGLRSYVRIVEGKKLVERDVQIGLRGSDGYVEIVQGLTQGDIVVVYEK